jgi:hypothetical protein
MFQENGDFTSPDGLQRGVQYPFSVNEKVIIKVSMVCFTINFVRLLLSQMVEGIISSINFYRVTGERPKNLLGKKLSLHLSVSMAGELSRIFC